MNEILIYGANGFVGREVSALAKRDGLNPILAGRNKEEIKRLSTELDLEYAVFSLEDEKIIDEISKKVKVILNCAGPFMKTFQPLVNACIKNKAHYLDITGEIPVYQEIYSKDEIAKKNKVMLLPGVGFDVAPTDCLALHLKEQFPSGDNLTLAFYSKGPAGIPPGTLKTMLSLIPYGNYIRKNGELIKAPKGLKSKLISFDEKLKDCYRINWGDMFTAYHSTGIPNIEVYAAFPKSTMMQMKFIEYFRPILKHPVIVKFLQNTLKGGSTAAEREKTSVSVYAELSDSSGKKAICRMKGPEAGLTWTSLLAIYALKKVLSGEFKAGYQTPASAFGYNFASDIEGIHMDDIIYSEE